MQVSLMQIRIAYIHLFGAFPDTLSYSAAAQSIFDRFGEPSGKLVIETVVSDPSKSDTDLLAALKADLPAVISKRLFCDRLLEPNPLQAIALQDSLTFIEDGSGSSLSGKTFKVAALDLNANLVYLNQTGSPEKWANGFPPTMLQLPDDRSLWSVTQQQVINLLLKRTNTSSAQA